MQIIRRLILALALMAGLVPAFAQAPPPVPALPDTERRTSYTISGTTCACAVNFALYGDSTDYQNWIEVWLNGVLQSPSAYTITSPTGPLATIPRPITDAVLTFNAVQTGTVQIVGARRPRRVSQFSENRGVAARDLNQTVTDLVAMLRENWDKTNDVSGRAVLARPGETLNLLPILANRQNQSACFDNSGNLSSCVSVSIPGSTFSAGTGINFTGTNPTVITTSTKTISVTDQPFGAKCDGSTDDTAAIQAAINSLPNDGGIVSFPVQNCKISSTLTIGNGTPSAVSTKRGVVLRGMGVPNTPTGSPVGNGYTTSNGPKLTWAGGAAPMISINGPLQGWGVQNLILDCASISSSIGLAVVSGQFGDNSNLTIQNCFVGISSISNPLGGYTGVGNVDALRNNWTNINVLVPAVAAAKGILLNGDSGGTSDTDYNVWTNVFIRSPGGVANFGLYLAVSDANVFNNISTSGFSTGGVGVQFDYSINSNFPGSTDFFHYEIGGNPSFNILGSPGALATPNRFYGLIQANQAPAPLLANTEAIEGPWRTYTPAPVCGTATFTVNGARFKTIGKTTDVQLDITISALGTCTNTITFTLPVLPNTSAGLAGQEVANRGVVVTGAIVAGVTIQLHQAGTTGGPIPSYAPNDRIVVSGVYENQ